jgi:Mycothiol maleylpyruvate isomerase N-terminal domain
VVEQTAALDALDAVYGQLTETVTRLGAAELMLPSRCAGWVAGDVLYHQLMDARRALRTFASPDPGPADRDDVTYWQAYAPRDADRAADAAHAAHARHVRIAAAAYAPDELIWEWTETAAAARRAARACRAAGVATQGYVLTPADFTATLVVEATVHYLDLTVHLPAAPPPAAALALVRRVLDGLAGQPLPASWDDVSCALKGTGRVPLDSADRAELGALAGRLPVFV